MNYKKLAVICLIFIALITISAVSAEEFVFLKDTDDSAKDFKIDFVYPQSIDKFIKSADCDKDTAKWLKGLGGYVVFYTHDNDYLIVTKEDAKKLYDFEKDKPLKNDATVSCKLKESKKIGSNTAYIARSLELSDSKAPAKKTDKDIFSGVEVESKQYKLEAVSPESSDKIKADIKWLDSLDDCVYFSTIEGKTIIMSEDDASNIPDTDNIEYNLIKCDVVKTEKIDSKTYVLVKNVELESQKEIEL